MKAFYILILVLLAGAAYGQSNLPACKGSDVARWSNCVGSWTASNGDKYVGEWKDGTFNGQGTYYSLADNQFKGDKVVGEFKDGKSNGQGTYYYLADNQYKGDKYVGEFKDSKKNGQGTYTWRDGNKYVGQFKDDASVGQGVYTFIDGRKWLAEWSKWQLDGRGIKYSTDGSIQESGIYKDSKLVTSQYIDPNSFTRIARNNSAPAVSVSQRQNTEQSNTQSNLPACPALDNSQVGIKRTKNWNNCFGTYAHGDGFIFVGTFQNGSPNGQGSASYPTGETYVGQYKDGSLNGKGTFTFPNGDKYVGQFKDEKRHGQGIYTEANGNKYAGEFKDGVRNGQGTYIFASGEKYIGEWKDSKYNGQGNNTNILGIGNSYIGEFREGIFNGQGTYTFANGDKYVGEWKDGKYNGLGIKYSSNGNVEKTGVFKDNILITSMFVDPNRFTRIDRSKITPIVSDTQRQESDQTEVQIDLERLQSVEERRRFEEKKFQLERQAVEKKALDLEKEKKLFSSNPKIKEIILGKVRFDCIVTCSFKFGYNRGQLKSYYESKNWVLLAEKIYELQQESDLSYYYLAQASEGLGYPEAALIYYNLALHDTNKCKGILNVCDGFNFPNDINLRVALIQNLNLPDKGRPEEKPIEVIKQAAAKSISNLSLKVSASEPDSNGVVTITVQTNTDTSSLKINGDELGGKTDGSYVVKRIARVGQETRFVLAATDIYGNTDSKTISVVRQVIDSRAVFGQLNAANVKQQPTRDAVAIIIGIEKYKRVAKADFANADAQDFYDYASRALGIKQENIKLLVDEGADDVEILGAFKNWLPLKVKKQKTDVYVFYSGHGLPSDDGKSLYLMPFSVDKNFIERTAINQQEIIAALQAVQPNSVTMFLDSCYSGQTRSGETLLASARPIALKVSESAYPANFTVISASAPDQLSSSSPDLKHGIFSYYLMKGMEGDADMNKDGKITVAEMQEYLTDAVGRQAIGMNRKQQPQLFGDADKVLVGR